jgi:hypothetical protein
MTQGGKGWAGLLCTWSRMERNERDGSVHDPGRNEIYQSETKRNETKWNDGNLSKRNETERNETKWNITKFTETKRNGTKQNEMYTKTGRVFVLKLKRKKSQAVFTDNHMNIDKKNHPQLLRQEQPFIWPMVIQIGLETGMHVSTYCSSILVYKLSAFV